jgi:heterodisulfide reductase subunit C
MISSIVFVIVLAAAGYLFAKKVGFISRNIHLGKALDRSDRKKERWMTMARVAMGQSKMSARPVAGLLHFFVYIGFVLINIEVLEIILDGIFGTHRLFHGVLGDFYFFVINFFEVLAVFVIVAVTIFWIRRMIIRIPRFWSAEMKGWPKNDALNILYIEFILMSALLIMNAADQALMRTPADQLAEAGLSKYALGMDVNFAISQFLVGWMPSDLHMLHYIERGAWWFHILGILAFLNYLPYSKHFHILLAFPNTFYAKLEPKTELDNLAAVTKEVEMMFDPSIDPYAAPAPEEAEAAPERFGAKDVQDLNWKQLMDAYTCTECGRCTSVCPANLTGKLLSPRKIMMDTRDRLDEVGRNIDTHGADYDDNKTLLNDYITPEELWACTTCNACTEACPVLIDPVSIIVDMRRYLVMEESQGPSEWAGMYTNIENNGAPWQFSQADRLNWKDE